MWRKLKMGSNGRQVNGLVVVIEKLWFETLAFFCYQTRLGRYVMLLLSSPGGPGTGYTQYMLLHSAVHYNTVLFSVIQCSAVTWNAVHCRELQSSVMQCNAMQCSIGQCTAVQCNAEHYNAVHLSVVQCSVVKQSEWVQRTLGTVLQVPAMILGYQLHDPWILG